MAMYDEDEPFVRPIRKQSFTVTAAPGNLFCWVAWDDGSVDGPIRVASIGTTLELQEISGKVRERQEGPAGKERTRREADFPVDIDWPGMDYAEVWFLLLPDNAGQWESLWTESRYVFFAEAAARAAAPELAEKTRAAKERAAARRNT